MRAHIITGGIVANTIEVESLDFLPGLIAATEGTIGDLYANGVFSKPPTQPTAVPYSVTRRQAKHALLLAGLLGNVQPALDAIADPVQKTIMQIEWDDSQEFERNRPSLIAIGTALGLDSTELDDLFITASGL
jgi:hypothetical protein